MEITENSYFNNSNFLNSRYKITNKENMKTIFNNCNIEYKLYNNKDAQITVIDSILNCQIYNDETATIIIDNDTTIGNSFYMQYLGNILTKNTGILTYFRNNRIYVGDNLLENQVIDRSIENVGTLTISNSTINTQINNKGQLILEDNVIFCDGCNFVGNGTYTINDINKIASYLQAYYGEYNFKMLQ